MRRFWPAVLLAVSSPTAWACSACVPLVEAGIYGENFVPHLLLTILPVAVLLAIAAGTYGVDRIRSKNGTA